MVTKAAVTGGNFAREMYKYACNELNAQEDYEFESALLCEKFFKIQKNRIITDFIDDIVLNDTDTVAFKAAVQKRKSGYPLQYILGEWNFYGRDFFVGEGVLIPRADTETLIETTLSYIKNNFGINSECEKNSLNILDLCSGTGCIAITLAKEIEKMGISKTAILALEKSDKAYSYLLKNIKRHNCNRNVTAIKNDALTYEFNKFNESSSNITKFDIIVSNPPYLSSIDMQNLQREVSYEPTMALNGSINSCADGTFFYRELTAHWAKFLKKGGLLAYEIGMGQEEKVHEIFTNNCFNCYCENKDLCGIIRVVSGIK